MAWLYNRMLGVTIVTFAACTSIASGRAAEEGTSLTIEDFLFDDASPTMPYKVADRDTPFHARAGDVGVFLSHHASLTMPGYVLPIIEIFENGSSAISAAFSDSETRGGKAWVALEALDPASDTPQIVLTRYDGGGTKCCFQTSIFTKVEGAWHRIDAPYQFNDLHYRIVNVNGRKALIGLDSDALSGNDASTMEGQPALQVLLLDGRSLVSADVADTQDQVRKALLK